MKKLLVLSALTILTTSSAGCCSSWYPGKYLGRTLGNRSAECSTCGDASVNYVETYNIPAGEIVETPGPK